MLHNCTHTLTPLNSYCLLNFMIVFLCHVECSVEDLVQVLNPELEKVGDTMITSFAHGKQILVTCLGEAGAVKQGQGDQGEAISDAAAPEEIVEKHTAWTCNAGKWENEGARCGMC